MHQDLLEELEAAGAGVGAYEQFAQACFRRALEDRDRAAFLFVLGTAAQRIAAHYFERPLSVKEADAIEARIRGHLHRLRAVPPEDAAGQLRAINEMAVDELDGAA